MKLRELGGLHSVQAGAQLVQREGGTFAGIGYALLCAVVQYATGVPWLKASKTTSYI